MKIKFDISLVIGKAVLLQARSGPEGSRKLRFPDFMTMAQDGEKVFSVCTCANSNAKLLCHGPNKIGINWSE